MVILDTATAAMFKGTMREFAQDVHRELHTDDYELWIQDRPDGSWDDGSEVEGWTLLASGMGRLRPNGAGGPRADDTVIFPESPYRFRTLADAFDVIPRKTDPSGDPVYSRPDVSHCVLVVNGERLFQVDAFKAGSGRSVNATAYVHELLDRALPGGTP